MQVRQALRDRLVLEHLPLVRAIAKRLHETLPASFDLDDLIQSGTIGLMESLDRYDPEIDFSVAAFVKHRIRGAILNSVRGSEYRDSTHEELPAEMPVPSVPQRPEVLDIRAAVAKLPPREREVLERHSEGETLVSIAVGLAVSHTRAKQLHRRAISRVQSHLAVAA